MDAQSEKKVTINQVASYCGVSKTTISRFLNGKYENMSAETKEKISAAVKALNYRLTVRRSGSKPAGRCLSAAS